MRKRWGPGPVFVSESLLNARRWQVYVGRSLFVVVMLAGMAIVWVSSESALSPGGGRAPTLQRMAEVGKGFFYALTGIQLSLVLLAAPAAAAGSICLDRMRGTLLHMLVTDLSDAEIVLGKLGSRLAPVFGLIVCGMPVAALAALLGGIDFNALFGAFAVALALAVLGCALALTISVWATKTHEVLMAVYMIESFWLLALPVWWGLSYGTKSFSAPPAWFQKLNPYVLVFAPYNQPGFATFDDYLLFVGIALGLSVVLLGLAIASLRRAVVAEAGRSEKAVSRRLSVRERLFPSLPGPSLDGNPVLWREWRRNRPTRLARWLWGIVLLSTWAMAAWGTYDVIHRGVVMGPNALVYGFLLQLVFGYLILSATAPTVLAEERVRGSLDVLLTTPLSTASIVVAKWWGLYRRVLVLAVLPLYTGVFLAVTTPDTPNFPSGMRNMPRAVPLTAWDRVFSATFCVGDFLASAAVIVGLGVGLATWIRRPGRAIATSVIAYFLVGIGWIFLVELVFSLSFSPSAPNQWVVRNRWVLNVVMGFSPIAGPINALEGLISYAMEQRTRLWIGSGLIIVVKSAIAAFLLWLTVRTFDRCLGRTPEARPSDRARGRVVLEVLAPTET